VAILKDIHTVVVFPEGKAGSVGRSETGGADKTGAGSGEAKNSSRWKIKG